MADINYDFPIPTISGQNITVQWLANDPRRIYRLLNTLVQRFLVGHKLLAGRVDLTGSGAAVYEIAESIVADLSSATVSPLAQYPLTTTTPGVLAAIKPLKDGLDSLIADEDIAHNRIDKVMRDLIKIANTLVLKADGLVGAAITSQVTQTQAASAAWNTAGGNPFLDAMLVKAAIIGQNKGYDPNIVACSFVQFAYAVSRSVVLQGVPRETANNIIATGNMFEIAGMTWVATNNLNSANPIVLDNTMLGSLAYEDLGGGYQGSAAPPSAADDNPAASGVQTKRWREESVDGVRVRARLVRAPMIQEPAAAGFITGVGV